MKLLLALVAFLQSANALHLQLVPRDAGSSGLKRITLDQSSNNFARALAPDASTTQDQKKPIPWWKLPNTDNGEMNALTGQQFHPFDDLDSDDESTTTDAIVCPLNQCQSSGVLGKTYCGPYARCLGGYCQCNLGWKPASNTSMARGWTGLEALTVWVDTTQMGCTVRCNSLSCSEVLQVKGCFDGQAMHDENEMEEDGDHDGLDTDGLRMGAIKAPGADIGQAT